MAESNAEPLSAKDYGPGGDGGRKASMGLLDVTRDLAALENNIPLSPQWLYAKNSDSRTGFAATSADARAQSSLPQISSMDSIQGDARRLDGSQDKKDWRRNAPDVESNRRWREEERETGLLGRRERRKEGDRETEYRKNDRRSDNAPTKESADFRAPPSSDRRHEAANRTSNNESRRDNKWSSRWGPEDKEDPRMEKKIDTDKEESHVEKQPVIGSSDKWRPLRQRQEIHSSGSAVYRAAPGVGAERGRVDGPNIRFAIGRGRAKFDPVLPCSQPPSSAPIGAAASVNSDLHEKYRLSTDKFRYQRGKLLDIYRKNKAHLTPDNTPEVFVEVPQITLSNCMNPLAFAKPDSVEVAVLEDIWKGKVKSSEACYDGEGTETGDCVTGPNIVGELCKNEVTALFNEKERGMSTALSTDGSCSRLPYSLPYFEETDEKGNMKNIAGSAGLPDSLFPDNSGAIDIHTKLPDDSSSLFDSPFVQETVSGANQHQSNNHVIEPAELGAPTMLSLSYMDPQGDIQGPFLVEDIINWHAEGFFGTDLPVRLSDAPDNTPFRPLGELITELSWTPESAPVTGPIVQSNKGENPRYELDAIAPTSELSNFFSTGSQDPVLHHGQPRMSESNVYTNSHNEKSPGIRSQNLHDLSGQDSEEVFYNRRSENLVDPFGKLANEMHGLPRTQSANHIPPSARGQAISFNQKIPTNDDVNALGLSWSELKGSHLKSPLSTNLSADGDQGHIISPFVGDDPSRFRHKEDQFTAEGGIVSHDAWPSNFRRNTSSNVPHDGSRLTGLQPETNRFNLEEHLLSQQLQNQQLQHPLNPLVGGDASRFRHKEDPFSVKGELLTHDSWPSNYKRNTTSSLHDASRLTRLMAENNHFNLEDHLLSQQFQNQELQQQRLDRQHLEQLQGPLHHQQSINQVIDMERLLKLQFQQQQHLHQLGQQQQLHQQQQQVHHRMQLLQEQHQRQQHQLLIEQLLHQQQHDSSLGASLVDPIRGDQIFNRQHLLNELQQQAHRLPMDHDASLDQRILDKFGRHIHQEQYNELLDILSHPSHRNGLSVEQQLLLGHQHEQLRSRQFPIDPRQQQGMIDERLASGVWSVDESGEFFMDPANSRKPPLERISSFEQQHHHDREAQFYDRMQRENYGLNSQHIERSTSVPRIKMDMLESHGHLSSAAHMGQYPSGVPPQHNRIPSQINGTYVDATARNWPGPTGQLENSLQDSQYIQFHLGLDKQKRDMPAAFSIENPNDWPSHIGEESSSHGLPNLYLSSDKMGSTDSFSGNSLVTKSGQAPQGHLTDLNFEGPMDAFEASRRLPFRTSSGASSERNQFFLTTSGNENEKLVGSIGGEMPKDGIDFSELNQGSSVNQLGTQRASMSRTVLGTSEAGVEKPEVSAIDLKSLNAKGPVRHASFGGDGVSLYNYDRGVEDHYVNEIMNDRMSGIFARGRDSSSVMRTHDILLSQGALTETVPVPVVKGNSSTSLARSDEMRRDSGGNMAGLMLDATSPSRKDTRFNRTPSYNNVDAPETSFIDMLKGTKKHTAETDTSADSQDTGPGGRSNNKKKGKKGRALDPSLLGFKVNSNRILKGEIQLPDD